jgi:hypothetical protein
MSKKLELRPIDAIVVCGDCGRIKERQNDRKVWCTLIRKYVDPKKFDSRCELMNRVAVPV